MEEYERAVQRYNSDPLPEPRGADNPVVMAGPGAWKELFTSPQYRRRTWVLIVCWMSGYAGLIYGVGAFLAVYMVDHGATAHEVFLTIAAAYLVLFVAFQVNARLGERVERRDVIALMAMLFAVVLGRGLGGADVWRSSWSATSSAGSAPACSCSTCTTTRRWPIRRASAPSRLPGPTASAISAHGAA